MYATKNRTITVRAPRRAVFGAARSHDNIRDMTEGSPMHLILGFALPLLAGFIFQQLYNLIDTMIVGRFLGVDALAGVGSTGSISFLIVGFCMGASSGFTIPISQKFGAGDYVSMRRYLAHGMYLCAAFAVVMTSVCALLAGQILRWMHTPETIYSYAYIYILIIFLGIPVTYAYNLLSGAIRALGDSAAPVRFLIISSLTNIALDLVFILCFHMGVAGAAVATILSQVVSVVLSLLYIKKKVGLLHIRENEWAFDADICRTLLSMGLPMGLQYSITAIGSVMLQSAVNSLGAVYVAAQTAGGKVGIFFCTPFDALGSTMATYGGQNVGAGKVDRLDKGLIDASILGCVYAVIAAIVLALFGDSLTGLFLSEPNPEVVQLSRMLLTANSLCYILLALVNIVRFLIQGMGYSSLAVVAGICEMVGRLAAALLLTPLLGYAGACLASPIAWLLADSFLIPAYLHCRKKTRALLG